MIDIRPEVGRPGPRSWPCPSRTGLCPCGSADGLPQSDTGVGVEKGAGALSSSAVSFTLGRRAAVCGARRWSPGLVVDHYSWPAAVRPVPPGSSAKSAIPRLSGPSDPVGGPLWSACPKSCTTSSIRVAGRDSFAVETLWPRLKRAKPLHRLLGCPGSGAVVFLVDTMAETQARQAALQAAQLSRVRHRRICRRPNGRDSGTPSRFIGRSAVPGQAPLHPR